MRIQSLACLLLVLVGTSTAWSAPHAQASGNAIVAAFTVQQAVARPSESLHLLLGVHNDNVASARELQPGDSFSARFRAGTVTGCADISVFSPSGLLSAGDFLCEVVENTVVLTFEGPPTLWPPSEAVSARVAYDAPPMPATVEFSVQSSLSGSYAPASPPYMLFAVGDGLGLEGPPGPAGPIGPSGLDGEPGPAGPAASGARVQVESTGAIRALHCEPPVLIPGLDTDIIIAEGSALLIEVDAESHPDCLGGVSSPVEGPAAIHLEVDNDIVASRRLVGLTAGGDGATTLDRAPVGVRWLSGALTAGSHRVRVLLEHVQAPQPRCSRVSMCVGGAEGTLEQARLVVVELRD